MSGFCHDSMITGYKDLCCPAVRPSMRPSVCLSIFVFISLRFSVNHLSAVFCQLLCFVLFYSFLCQNFHDKLKFSLNCCVSATVKRDELFKKLHNEVPVNSLEV